MSAKTTPATATPATKTKAKTKTPAVLALRKACSADGMGLSHYILMDPKKA